VCVCVWPAMVSRVSEAKQFTDDTIHLVQ